MSWRCIVTRPTSVLVYVLAYVTALHSSSAASKRFPVSPPCQIKMCATFTSPTWSSDHGDKAPPDPMGSPTFYEIFRPSPSSNEDGETEALEGPMCPALFLQAPKPPEMAPSQAPYRINNVISASQLFGNRPYVKAAAAVAKGETYVLPRKPIRNAAMTSSATAPERQARPDAIAAASAALPASSDLETMQMPMVTPTTRQTTCLRPQDPEQESSGFASASSERPATQTMLQSAGTTGPKESHALVPGVRDLRNTINSLLLKITRKHDTASRESRENYAMYRGRVLNSCEMRDYLLVKASQKHTGVAESRILRREAEFLDGSITQAQRIFERSRRLEDKSESTKDMAEILRAVDELCHAVSSQWRAADLGIVPNSDTDVITRPSSPASSDSSTAFSDFSEEIQQHSQTQQLLDLFAEQKVLHSQNKHLLSRVETLQQELDQLKMSAAGQ